MASIFKDVNDLEDSAGHWLWLRLNNENIKKRCREWWEDARILWETFQVSKQAEVSM